VNAVIPEIGTKMSDIERVCRRLGVRRLELFGSAAVGAFRSQSSDIDLLVEFEPEAIDDAYADRYFDLLESLEQLFGRPIDLVVDSAIKNPYFRESVDRTKALLYAA
jgi:uncharacterized protein